MVSLVLLGACVTADVGLIYGTRTYNTKRVAEKIAKASGLVAIPVEKLTLEAFSAFDHLIVGAPTLNTGNVVRRSGTPMDEFLYTVLPAAGSLHGKKVALFGLGEQMPYPSSFCEALDELGTCFRDSGAQLIGRWPLDGYDIWESRAVWNGEFVGLTIDEEDQPELTDERIERWLKQLKAEGMPLCLQNEARRHLVELASENDWYEVCVCVWGSFGFFLSLTPISPNCHTPILPIASENDWYEVRVCVFLFFFSLSLTRPHFTQLSHAHSSHISPRHLFLLLSALGTPRRLLVERAPRSLAEHLAELRGRSRAASEREARCGPRPNAQAHHCSARMRVDPSRSASARDAPGDATRRWHPL